MGYCRNCRLYQETFQRGCENPRGSSSESTERVTSPLLFLSPSLISSSCPTHFLLTPLCRWEICVRIPRYWSSQHCQGFTLEAPAPEESQSTTFRLCTWAPLCPLASLTELRSQGLQNLHTRCSSFEKNLGCPNWIYCVVGRYKLGQKKQTLREELISGHTERSSHRLHAEGCLVPGIHSWEAWACPCSPTHLSSTVA